MSTSIHCQSEILWTSTKWQARHLNSDWKESKLGLFPRYILGSFCSDFLIWRRELFSIFLYFLLMIKILYCLISYQNNIYNWISFVSCILSLCCHCVDEVGCLGQNQRLGGHLGFTTPTRHDIMNLTNSFR